MAEAPGRIRRLIADKGYDADWLRTDLRTKGITPVIPGTRARKRRVHHDKRRYRERWRIEATCLGNLLDVEASDLAIMKAEDVSNRFVLQSVRLAL
jgi:transposase